MKPRSRGSLGILLVVVGLAMFLIAMFTGLNEYPEGSFPEWLKVVQALGGLLPRRSRGRDRIQLRSGKGDVIDDRPRYMISVAAEIVGMHPQTLRIYESKGLVRPGRTPGGTRLYSERDLERLRAIQRLTTELGLNLAGVQRVLVLEDELEKLRARIERMEVQMREEVDRVHRHYRREVVLWSQSLPERK